MPALARAAIYRDQGPGVATQLPPQPGLPSDIICPLCQHPTHPDIFAQGRMKESFEASQVSSRSEVRIDNI